MPKRTRFTTWAVVKRFGGTPTLVGVGATQAEAHTQRAAYAESISPGKDWDTDAVCRYFDIEVIETSVLV
jgi:hypothetical protein